MEVPSDDWIAVTTGSTIVQNVGEQMIYLTTAETPAPTDVPYVVDEDTQTEIDFVKLAPGQSLDLSNVTGPVYARALRNTGRVGTLT